jgi:hypothetical protein
VPSGRELFIVRALSSQLFTSFSVRLAQTFQIEIGIGAKRFIFCKHQVLWDLEFRRTSIVLGGKNGIAGPRPALSCDDGSFSIWELCMLSP